MVACAQWNASPTEAQWSGSGDEERASPGNPVSDRRSGWGWQGAGNQKLNPVNPCVVLLLPCVVALAPCGVPLVPCVAPLVPCAVLLVPCVAPLVPCVVPLVPRVPYLYARVLVCWFRLFWVFRGDAC